MPPQFMKCTGIPENSPLLFFIKVPTTLMKTTAFFLRVLVSFTAAVSLPLHGQSPSAALPAADPAKVAATEKDMNLPATSATRSRGARSFSPGGGDVPVRKAVKLEGGYRLRGFTARGGLPPALLDYQPGTVSNLGSITSGHTPAEKHATSKAIAAAADLEKVSATVDDNSHSRLNDIQFKLDTADFADQDKALADISVIIELMKRHPSATLLIRGHTCDLGDDRYNLVLSGLRANKVHAWLVVNGVPENRLDRIAYGEQLPAQKIEPSAADAVNEVARRANRRVFFQLLIPVAKSS